MNRTTHRRTTNQLPDNCLIQFCDNDDNHSYGEHVWTLETKLGEIPEEVVEFAANYYEVELEEAEQMVNPPNIVDTADAWDDPQFWTALWEAMENQVIEEKAGFITPDGAVVLDIHSVKMSYTHEQNEENHCWLGK